MNTPNETFTFQAEVQQLLQLMIHSLYSDREIFLRELISNASDACDKLRFDALTDAALLEEDGDLHIDVQIDKAARTITVTDNGIGMSRDEVLENIGTIARSGTRRFLDTLAGPQSTDVNLIGQFGVGFYSVFMVADRVSLETRRAGTPADAGVRWESDGTGEYHVAPLEAAARGTCVTLYLKDDAAEFLDSHRLRHIIRTYSDHISLPIRMPAEEAQPSDKPEDEPEADPTEDAGGAWERVNAGAALWARPRKDITDEDYQAFYKTLSHDATKPLAVIHNRVEGSLEYVALFFIPATAPFDLWDRERRHGVKLYVRRIFIMDDTKYLLPAYLRFVRGVVDTADLPLNVSREFLQKNKDIDKIRGGSVKKILGELKKMADNAPDDYATFWGQFGRVLKEGVMEDTDNQPAIAALLRFASTASDSDVQNVSLDEYVQRMPLKQEAIYYLTADSYAAAKASPHLEIFRKHGVEVLLLSDQVDEWLVNQLAEYRDKPLKSVARGSVDLSKLQQDTDTPPNSDADESATDGELVSKLKELLGEQVKDVRLSSRLTDSPSCLVADEHDLGGNLQRILAASGQELPTFKPILEINPTHPLVRHLTPATPRLDDWARVLLDQATLAEGSSLAEPADFVRRINSLLTDVAPVADQGPAISSSK